MTPHPASPHRALSPSGGEDKGEGGDVARTRRARWWIIAVPALLYFFSYFHRIAPVVVAQDLMRAFEVTAAALGFTPSGHIDNLPQGTRELLFYKRIAPRGA